MTLKDKISGLFRSQRQSQDRKYDKRVEVRAPESGSSDNVRDRPVHASQLPETIEPAISGNILDADSTYSYPTRPGDLVVNLAEQEVEPTIQQDEDYYQPIRELGSGGFSQVDAVQSKLTNKIYARKRISTYGGRARSKLLKESFENEVRIMRRLQHKHLIQVLGSYSSRREMAIIMSPVADSNLTVFLDLDMDVDDRRSSLRLFFGGLSAALSYLHDNLIRHKDIKPSNILVSGHNVLLADFGISSAWDGDELDDSVTIAGVTPKYSAPEVANSERGGAFSDVFSLGCVFLEMVTVLNNRTLRAMNSFFQTHGSGDSKYWHNLHASSLWASYLTIDPRSQMDLEPLSWIKEMLEELPSHRPTARTLMGIISKFAETYDAFFDPCLGDLEHSDHHPHSRFEHDPSRLQIELREDISRKGSDLALRKLDSTLSASNHTIVTSGRSTLSLAKDHLGSVPWESFPHADSLPSIDLGIGMDKSTTFIDSHTAGRVSSILSKQFEIWSSGENEAEILPLKKLIAMPRICMILSLIHGHELLFNFLDSGTTDKALPLKLDELEQILGGKQAKAFDREQYRAVVRDLVPEAISSYGEKELLPFRKIRDLGLGAFARVEGATNVITGEKVARKIFELSKKDEQKLKASIEKEITSLQRLRGHQHIVQYLGCYTRGKSMGLILSPIADCDLHKFLRSPDIEHLGDRNEILTRSFGCLVSALGFMHSQKIRHKDIKPLNILLQQTSNHTAKVLFTDFGIAMDFAQAKNSMTYGRPQMTEHYCAPEVAKFKKRGRKSDVFSLGCVFVEISTVLAGMTLDDLEDFIDRDDGHFYQNIDELFTWITKMSMKANARLQFALKWVKPMLTKDPDTRPYVTDIIPLMTQDLKASKPLRSDFFCEFCLEGLRVTALITSEKGVEDDDTATVYGFDQTLSNDTSSKDQVTEGHMVKESPSDIIGLSHTYEIFLACLEAYNHFINQGSLPAECDVLRTRMEYELLRLLNWSQAVGLSNYENWSYSNTNQMDLVTNLQTILNILIQQNTLIGTALGISTTSQPPEDSRSFPGVLKAANQPEATANHSGRDHLGNRQMLPSTSLRLLRKLLTGKSNRMALLEGSSRPENASHDKEDVETLTHALCERNDDLRKLMSEKCLTLLRERDEETNLQLLQLFSSFEDLHRLAEAVWPQAILEEGENVLRPQSLLPRSILDTSNKAPLGVWSKTALARFALFKALNTRETRGPEDLDVRVSPDQIIRVGVDEGEEQSEHQRCQALFRMSNQILRPVWIEWKTYDPTWNMFGELGPPPRVTKRIEELTAILKDRRKPLEFRAPTSLGYFHDVASAEEDRWRFGLIFEIPPSPYGSIEPVSLRQLLTHLDFPTPRERLNLATAVSSCVLYLHATNWLHRGLRSHAVIFFREEEGRVNLSKPLLSGFDYSRPALGAELTDIPSHDPLLDMYRHPRAKAEHRYKQSFDVYALGVVLLEIAYWQPIDVVLGLKDVKRVGAAEIMRVHKRLSEHKAIAEGLTSRVGETFARVVIACLSGVDIDSEKDERDPRIAAQLQAAFFNVVVKPLTQLTI